MKTLKTKENNKGFTIVETLVAISILVLSLTGPLVIISQALKASYFSRDEVTAFYLAQEGIEYIRNVRDETSLSSNVGYMQWMDGVTGGISCETNNTCINKFDDKVPAYKFNIVHTGSNYSFVPCDTTGCAPLTFEGAVDANNVPYGGAAGENSQFTRTIWLTTVPGDPILDGNTAPAREVVIHVEITWNQGSAKNKFTLESHLLNWKLEQ